MVVAHRAAADRGRQDRLADLTPDGGTSPEAFERFVAAEVTKWAEVVRRSGAKVDG